MTTESLPSVDPAQLCIGLFVCLDLSWMDHPFTFSQFKIKSDDQIATLQTLGLDRVHYDPARSSSTPLALDASAATPIESAEQPAEAPPAEEENTLQLAYALAATAASSTLDLLRSEIRAVERQFQQAADALRNINRSLQQNPRQAHAEATALVDTMVEQMLAGSDVKVHALSEQMSEGSYLHSLNVAVLCLTLGKALELPSEQMKVLGMGALFHDIGHLRLPSQLLNRGTTLNRPEQALYETHCLEGIKLGQQLGLCDEALQIIARHHEHIDGSGYPARLKADQLSPLVRIVAIVNHYDNLCNATISGAALSPSEALSQMFAFQRQKLDDTLLRLFIRCLGVYPPGSIVQLADERIGMVLAVNQQASLKPSVLLYDPTVPREHALIVDLTQEPGLKIARAFKPALLPREVFQYLSPRKHVTYFFDPQRAEASR